MGFDDITEQEKIKAMRHLRAEIFGYVKEQIKIRRWLTLLFFVMISYIIWAVTRPNPEILKTAEAVHENLVLIQQLRADAAKAREENLIMQERFLKQDSIRNHDTLFYLP